MLGGLVPKLTPAKSSMQLPRRGMLLLSHALTDTFIDWPVSSAYCLPERGVARPQRASGSWWYPGEHVQLRTVPSPGRPWPAPSD
jgi:hypothetical protein